MQRIQKGTVLFCTIFILFSIIVRRTRPVQKGTVLFCTVFPIIVTTLQLYKEKVQSISPDLFSLKQYKTEPSPFVSVTPPYCVVHLKDAVLALELGNNALHELNHLRYVNLLGESNQLIGSLDSLIIIILTHLGYANAVM